MFGKVDHRLFGENAFASFAPAWTCKVASGSRLTPHIIMQLPTPPAFNGDVEAVLRSRREDQTPSDAE